VTAIMRETTGEAQLIGGETAGARPLLVAHDLTKAFGQFVAVGGVSLTLNPGSIHALIGPNGAGKTTCFNLLTKQLQPTSGAIIYKGVDITSRTPDEVARMGIARSFQISSIFPSLTVLENVRIALQRKRGLSYDFWRPERILTAFHAEAMALLEQVGLADNAQNSSGQLSYGRKRALEIATTLALDPELMLLDEPTAGMGHDDVGKVVQLIERVAIGRTVLLVEHNLSVIEDLCDGVTVLVRGRVISQGDYKTVSSDPAVIAAYLGAS
jgi:branched-chain amino acid transport system ATP-binding protein